MLRKAGLAGGIAWMAAQGAFAQAPTREEIERVRPPALPPSAGQRLTVEGEIERAPCPLATGEYKDIQVDFAGADFEGLGALSPDLLRPAWSRFVGQKVPIATVCDIRDEAATILRRSGYLAAVQVPPQRISDGRVKFDVLMAKLVGFQVRGDAGRAEGLIGGYLEALKAQPVFNIVDAERYLLLARDIPGYDVRLTLRPAGTVPGEVIGEVVVTRTPVELDVNIQNYGSRSVGRFGGLAQLRLNGVFGAGDRTTLGYFTTQDFEEQHVAQFGEEVRIGKEGLVFATSFTHAWTHPTLAPGLDVRSRTILGTFEARYPLVRRQTRTLYATGGLEVIEQRARFAGLPLTEDRLRVLFARAQYDSIDPESLGSARGYSAAEPKWRFGFSAEARQGISIFNASTPCGPALVNCIGAGVVPPSRFEGDPTAFILRASAYGEFRFKPSIAVSIAPRMQYAPNPLMGYEEFSAGNFTVGRGYDPGFATGDSGLGYAAELKLGSLIPRKRDGIALQGYGFLDAAWIWNEDSNFAGQGPQKLVSAGGGARIAFGSRATLDVGAAVPLRRAGPFNLKPDTRILMNLTVRLLPWRQ